MAFTATDRPSEVASLLRNAAAPTETDLSITFQKELEIGTSTSDANSIVYLTADLAVDSEDRIYALDASAKAVKVFSPSGELLTVIGGQGQGPGEFTNPVALAIHDEAGLVVAESMPPRVTFFDADGTYGSSAHLDFTGLVTGVEWLDGRHLLIQKVTPTDNGDGFALEYSLTLTDRSGKRISDVFSMRRAREAGQQVIFERDSYRLDWCVDGDGRVVIVDDPYTYAVQVLDSARNVLRVLEKDAQPVERSEQQIEELGTELRAHQERTGLRMDVEWSPFAPIITDVFVDDRSRLWVATTSEQDGEVTLDLYDHEGVFLTVATLPSGATGGFQVRGERIYFLCPGLDPGICVYRIDEKGGE